MLEKKLEEIGLNKKEAKIYLATLELGETTIARIAQKSGLKRTSIYNILDDLKRKGLISSSKGGRKNYYFAQDPKKLEARIKQRTKTIEEIMPELLSITNLIDKKPKVRYYEGREEMKEIYEDTLNYSDQEIKIWIPENTISSYDNYWKDYYIPKRLEKKIIVKAIAPLTAVTKKFKSEDKKQLRITKISKTNFIEAELMLYGTNKISIVSFDEMMGLLIESKKLFNTLKGLFEVHWGSLE